MRMAAWGSLGSKFSSSGLKPHNLSITMFRTNTLQISSRVSCLFFKHDVDIVVVCFLFMLQGLIVVDLMLASCCCCCCCCCCCSSIFDRQSLKETPISSGEMWSPTNDEKERDFFLPITGFQSSTAKGDGPIGGSQSSTEKGDVRASFPRFWLRFDVQPMAWLVKHQM